MHSRSNEAPAREARECAHLRAGPSRLRVHPQKSTVVCQNEKLSADLLIYTGCYQPYLIKLRVA